MAIASQPIGRRLGRTRTRLSAGIASLEFVVILPVMLLMILPVIDLVSTLRANIIMINMSREVASFAARSPLSPQTILTSLTDSSPGVDMPSRGMVFISVIAGTTADGARLLEQYRWKAGAGGQPSQVWAGCTGWSSETARCTSMPVEGLPVNADIAGQIADGEVIYVVESMYQNELLFDGFSFAGIPVSAGLEPQIYVRTIF